MATDLERLVVQLSADIKGYENAMRKAQGVTNRSARAIEQRFAQANKTLAANFVGLGSAVGRGLAAIGVGVGLRDFQQLIDASTRVQNSLKVAGLAGDELTKVYDRLFASAQQNATPIESLADLYSRASLSANDLGASQEQLLTFVDKVAEALRVSGKSAEESSGALLQLSQLLGSGTVRAEEFNSVQEGALPILQAVATGLKEAGGSVAELRKLVIDGKVSSEAFFKAFEAGSGILDEKLAGAQETVAQGFVRVQNTLIDAAGKFDKVTGASRATIEQLDRLAGIVRGLSAVFEAAANGPIGTYIEKIGKLNAALKSVLPGIAALGLLDETTLNAIAGQIDRIGAGPTDIGTIKGDPRNRGHFKNKTNIKTFSIKDAPATSKDSGGSKSKRVDELKREIEQIAEHTRAVQAETAALAGLNPLVNDYGYAAEHARVVQELLNAALHDGKIKTADLSAATPELRANILGMADDSAKATAAQERLAESQDLVRERMEDMRDLGKDVLGGFIDDLVHGKDAGEAFAGVLEKIGSKLLDISLNSLFDSKSAGGLDILSLLFGGGGFKTNTTFTDFLGYTPSAAPTGASAPSVPRLAGASMPAGMHLPKISGAAAGGNVAANVNVSIDARGADEAGLARVAQQVAQLKADLPGQIVVTVKQAQKSRVLR